MRDIIAMVLAGGRVEELSVLTMVRSKASVPFGGQYRIIDFALSSLIQAEIEQVGVISLYRPSSLIDHVGTGGPWDLIGRGQGIKILPPYTADTTSAWYSGTADAVYQNLDFIYNSNPRDVLVLSGDHIFHMDFTPFIAQHRQTNADLTIVVTHIKDRALGRGRFGFAELDKQGRVLGYEEKPVYPRSDFASMTIYLFKTDVLVKRLQENARYGRTHQLYNEVLPAMVASDRVYAHRYTEYWNYTRSVDAYYQANMDLLGENALIKLEEWQVRSRKHLRGLGDLPPTQLEQGAICKNSIVSPGVYIAGTVNGCVLSPNVRIEAGAYVTDSVVMHNTLICANAHVHHAILDKDVVVGKDAHIGSDEITGALDKNLTLIGKRAQVLPQARVGYNCLIYPYVSNADWKDLVLNCGDCLQVHKENTI